VNSRLLAVTPTPERRKASGGLLELPHAAWRAEKIIPRLPNGPGGRCGSTHYEVRSGTLGLSYSEVVRAHGGGDVGTTSEDHGPRTYTGPLRQASERGTESLAEVRLGHLTNSMGERATRLERHCCEGGIMGAAVPWMLIPKKFHPAPPTRTGPT
jgi:hypothetical protein